MLCTHKTTILCQFGLFCHELTTISPPILSHFWWELYQNQVSPPVQCQQLGPAAVQMQQLAANLMQHPSNLIIIQPTSSLKITWDVDNMPCINGPWLHLFMDVVMAVEEQIFSRHNNYHLQWLLPNDLQVILQKRCILQKNN